MRLWQGIYMLFRPYFSKSRLHLSLAFSLLCIAFDWLNDRCTLSFYIHRICIIQIVYNHFWLTIYMYVYRFWIIFSAIASKTNFHVLPLSAKFNVTLEMCLFNLPTHSIFVLSIDFSCCWNRNSVESRKSKRLAALTWQRLAYDPEKRKEQRWVFYTELHSFVVWFLWQWWKVLTDVTIFFPFHSAFPFCIIKD